MENPGTFGEWLKLRRRMFDLTQEELARRAGCSVFALRKIESGERRPSKQLACLLANALEIPLDEQQTFVRVARGERNLERLPAPSLKPAAGPAAPARRPAAPHLPGQAAPLVGRQRELAALERIFDNPQCRLLTLTGVGGIGKTRLAVEFAAGQLAAFPGGVYYASLASLSSPDLVVLALADALGLTFSGPNEPEEQLWICLADRARQPALLVLDNFEHLLAAPAGGDSRSDVTALVMEILERLPNVKILATSRERLNLLGEWMFELHGLPTPSMDFIGELEDYGAVALFLVSARRLKPDLVIQKDDQAALIRICQLLEGIPLALELAAAWVGMLSLQEITREIEAGLDFLTTSMRDVPERHRSIRASFDHSWKLLSDEERCTLQRLSVFHGGFSRHAAEQISGASLASLASLHSKSLVRRTEEGRFDLHEVIRQYALPHFSGDPHTCETCDRHSEYYLGLVRDREKALKSAAQQEVVRELTVEMDNLRAAWTWAIQCEKFESIGQAAGSFGWFCVVAGWLREGIEQFEPVVQVLRPRIQEIALYRRVLGLALVQQGILNFRRGRFDRAQAAFEESLAVLRPLGDPVLLAGPLVWGGVLIHLMGDIAGAQTLTVEGLACARAAGDRWLEAYALYNLGFIASLTGRYAQGYEQMLAGLDMWRALGDPSIIALGLNYISSTAIQLGFLEQARAFLQESFTLCKQMGDRWSLGTVYRNLGLVALAQGSTAEAQATFRKSLEVFGDYTVGWDIARAFTYLGDAALAAGDLPEARTTFAEALRVAVEAKSVPIALDAIVGLARLQLQTGAVERAFELASYALNHAAGSHETKNAASHLVMEAGEKLGEGQIQALMEVSQRRSIESIMEWISSLDQ